MNKPRSRGRPPKAAKAMLVPITLRLPEPLNREIEAIVQERALQGEDKSSVMRELMVRGLQALRAEKKAGGGS